MLPPHTHCTLADVTCHHHPVPLQAVCVRDLGLSSEAACLQFAFALWAEELAATVPGSGQPGSKKQGKKEAGAAAAWAKAAGKRPPSSEPTAAGSEGQGEQVATSSGKDRPAKKAKA
jgi:hypothetical protein